jgi:hypothetical protein
VTARSVVRFVLWLVLLAACGWALLFGAVVVFGGDTGTRLGGLVLAVAGGPVAVAARMALNRLPAAHKPSEERPAVQLPDDAEDEFTLRGKGRFAKSVSLRVGADGFEVDARRRRLHQSWDDVERFRDRNGTVGYTLRSHRSPIQRFARWVTGFDRSLPTLAAPPEQLAETMERYRERYSFYP